MPNPRPKLNPRYPQPGQLGFWKDREAGLHHARTVLCAAGGRVSGKKTIAYAQAAFEAKYPGCTIADVRKGRAFLEQKAAAVRAREMSVMEAEAAERKAETEMAASEAEEESWMSRERVLVMVATEKDLNWVRKRAAWPQRPRVPS